MSEAQSSQAKAHSENDGIFPLPKELLYLVAGNLTQADVKCLLLTCHKLHDALKWFLLRQDIDLKLYNALCWACYYGNVSLGTACFAQGAEPNAAFFRNQDRPLKFVVEGSRDEPYMTRFNHQYFLFPVYPTKALHHIPMLYNSDCVSCSALAVATKRDHREMVKVLLRAGACAIERRHHVPAQLRNYEMHPSFRDGFTHLFSHEAVISHARSVEVARLLLEAGGPEYLDFTGISGYSPLEVFLAQFSQCNSTPNFELAESEVYAITKLFLDHGASTEAVNLYAGSLCSAMATGYLSIVKLVLQYTKVTPLLSVDHRDVLLVALGESRFRSDLSMYNTHCRERLLSLLLDTGLNPNMYILGKGSLLDVTIKSNVPNTTRILLDRGADPNLTYGNSLTPLSRVICVGSDPSGNFELIIPLLRVNADINGPSMGVDGFTPLMFATSDLIPESTFSNLITFGADIRVIRRITLRSRLMSLLQCLFLGFPEVKASGDSDETCNFYKDNKLEPLSWDTNYDVGSSDGWRCTRKVKFEMLKASSLPPNYFHTPDGRHMLNWAIENLYQGIQEWAVEILLRLYKTTKLPGDSESPLWVLLSTPRVVNYLAFGTLRQTLSLAQALVKAGFPLDERNGETLVHRVCRLYQTVPNRRILDQALKHSPHLDVGQFVRTKDEDWPEEKNFVGKKAPPNTNGALWLEEEFLTPYMRRRAQSIASLIELFIRNGVDFYAKNRLGKTAFEMIRNEMILKHLPEDVRDLEKEKQIIKARRVVPS